VIPTSPQQVVEFGNDTTQHTTNFCLRQLVTDLLQTCYGETGVMDLNW